MISALPNLESTGRNIPSTGISGGCAGYQKCPGIRRRREHIREATQARNLFSEQSSSPNPMVEMALRVSEYQPALGSRCSGIESTFVLANSTTRVVFDRESGCVHAFTTPLGRFTALLSMLWDIWGGERISLYTAPVKEETVDIVQNIVSLNCGIHHWYDNCRMTLRPVEESCKEDRLVLRYRILSDSALAKKKGWTGKRKANPKASSNIRTISRWQSEWCACSDALSGARELNRTEWRPETVLQDMPIDEEDRASHHTMWEGPTSLKVSDYRPGGRTRAPMNVQPPRSLPGRTRQLWVMTREEVQALHVLRRVLEDLWILRSQWPVCSPPLKADFIRSCTFKLGPSKEGLEWKKTAAALERQEIVVPDLPSSPSFLVNPAISTGARLYSAGIIAQAQGIPPNAKVSLIEHVPEYKFS
ncbi:hypothetical protein B0I35DRAFT_413470 [Stachybotrys elegans]|uniref:HNH nuclease domain-containing protein n=1 Tax=Stachybotrys elegans TaxID=80388 RepID=A0A8K0WKU6_9HYPO|nr:hypothetical protein B0I35DRAFT_413470 [Stachybotrys elegans]